MHARFSYTYLLKCAYMRNVSQCNYPTYKDPKHKPSLYWEREASASAAYFSSLISGKQNVAGINTSLLESSAIMVILV